MASTQRNIAPRLSAEPGEVSPSAPFSGGQARPHTSISKLPELPAPVESAAQRKRAETQELRTKIESQGTEVCIYAWLMIVIYYYCANEECRPSVSSVASVQ